MSGYTKNDGLVFLIVFVVSFIVLKLAGVVKWPWPAVFELILICVAFLIFIVLLVILMYFIYCLIRGIIESVKK